MQIQLERGRHLATRGAWSRDRIEYRALVAVSFVICLAMAAAGRLFARRPETGLSIFAQARSDAHAAIGYAFHG